jgi:hypothetical protein
MSRHRLYRNLDINSALSPLGCHLSVVFTQVLDELDDHALSDGGEDDAMTPEQQGTITSKPSIIHLTTCTVQMADGLERIHSILGTEDTSGLSDETIQRALWDAWFDVEGAVRWLMGVF